MRIVGGTYRSRTLLTFSGNDVRPTPDKVREALFNILRDKVYGCKFLDLFCGTGAMGIEALSRGAKFVLFNDKAKESVDLAKKNLQNLKIENGFKVERSDALLLLENPPEKFDLIYIDPPYASDLGVKALGVVKKALADGGVVVFEDEKPFVGKVEGLTVVDERKYGRVRLTLFKKGE